ncbi:MAG: DUF4956 domain-containing protein [Eubacteriales bacterium]
MFEKILESIFLHDGIVMDINFYKVLLCFGVALAMGFLISLTYMRSGECTRSYAVSLVILPLTVCAIILLVNGDLGMSIAVLGTFSLVRFRSTQGSAQEIASILACTAVGIACGVGFVLLAVLLAVVLSALLFILSKTKYGITSVTDKELKILIPESLNYIDAFDDLFETYTTTHTLTRSKTTNLGSMYELSYFIHLKQENAAKEFMDAIRVRNGNLPVILSVKKRSFEEL